MTMFFDVLLVGMILILAWRSIASDDLFHGIVLFIVMGLLIALAWLRLSAPDAALAEAAIGAGLAGALLLVTLIRLEGNQTQGRETLKVSAGLLSLGLLLGLGFGFWSLVDHSTGLSHLVNEQLSVSGVSHPVTAVLLNFRAWDTALELAVLLWAWLAQRALGPEQQLTTIHLPGGVLSSFMHGFWPLIALVAAYLLWRGAFAPGGAFQSGAILAAGLLMMWLAGAWGGRWSETVSIRLAWVAGFWLFVWVGLLTSFVGMQFIEYPVRYAGSLILAIELAATLSIAFALAWMFTGTTGVRREVE